MRIRVSTPAPYNKRYTLPALSIFNGVFYHLCMREFLTPTNELLSVYRGDILNPSDSVNFTASCCLRRCLPSHHEREREREKSSLRGPRSRGKTWRLTSYCFIGYDGIIICYKRRLWEVRVTAREIDYWIGKALHCI